MKYHPILFSTPMVRAILEGRKTQTRRILKRQPSSKEFYINDKCPYGQVGDLLWVRETIRLGAWREDGRMAFDYKASPEIKNTPWVNFDNVDDGEKFEKFWIKICNELHKKNISPDKQGHYTWEPGNSPLNWIPSIFMPKAACRIWLEITDIHVNLLNDIRRQDALAEGIYEGVELEDTKHEETYYQYIFGGKEFKTAIDAYKALWQKINGKDSWNTNPWVWVVEFKRVEKPAEF